jgi:hypothetical protein
MKRRKHTKVTPVSPGRKPSKSGRVYSTYDQEYQARPENVKKRVQRNADRRKAEHEGRVSKGDGKDVHHVSGASRGGKTRVESASTNRGRK